jgi:lipopolysaccharide heptosyltransferase II
VDWYLSVLPPLGVPVHRNFTWLPERPAMAAALREKWDAAGSRWVALQPGARWTNKRWPAEHFAALVRHGAAAWPDVRFAILGGPGERSLAATIAAAAPSRTLNLAGGTSLPEMVEWLRLSDLLVSNDTGPLHIAAALGRPVIALFGPTEPRRTGPYGQLEHTLRHPLPCAPCLKDTCRHSRPLECLEAITPAIVAARLDAMLQARRP